MIKNYFKISLRNFGRNKLYSFINITGLSVGIMCCVLIFGYVQYETSFDRFNKNADRIYRLTEVLHLPKEDNARAVTSPPMATAIQFNFPEVEKAVRINYSVRILSYRETKLYDTKIMYADSTLFDVFTFPMVEGNAAKALVNPYSVVLTESAEKKYFGSEPAFGKVMQLSDTINLTVTGIIKDVPSNSHFTFDCILSHVTINEMNHHQPEDNWFNNGSYTYLLLSKDANPAQLEGKISDFIGKEMVEEKKATGLWYNLKLQPLTDIHLRSKLNSEVDSQGDITYVYIFSIAAILILLIACCNFINLSTAKSIGRAKEIGLRKVIGARRLQLTFQFLSESFLLVVVAALLSIGLLQLLLPWFNSFTSQSLRFLHWNNHPLLFLYGGIIVGVSLLAGIYPAFLMSSFSPVKVLKGNIKHGWEDIFLRKGLVVFQFTAAIILIIATTLVFQQLQFIQNKKLGLNKEQVVEIELSGIDGAKTETLLSELKKNPAVVNGSLTDFSFKNGISRIAMLPEGALENEVRSENVISVDENFLKTFQVELVAGRDFSKAFSTDPQESFIVNETAVRDFGWGSPADAIGKNINWNGEKKGKVIGVVKDFNYSSLHDQIKPLIIQILPGWYGYVALRIQPGNLQQTLSDLESKWKINSSSSFSYSFLDEDFAHLYKAEQNLQRTLGLFTLLSIFIACLGLFGLAAAMVKQRFREVGIRKVLGASIMSVVSLLSKDFLKLVMVAIFIAIPVTWIAVSKWLENFAYRVNVNWWVFGIAAITALLIAFITVSIQAMKAAIVNPVKSLRTE